MRRVLFGLLIASLGVLPAIAQAQSSVPLKTAPDGTAMTAGNGGNSSVNENVDSQQPLKDQNRKVRKAKTPSLKTAPDGTAMTAGNGGNASVNENASSQTPLQH